MTIDKAKQLLEIPNPSQSQLINGLEDLSKEYGYVQGMTIAGRRDLVSGRKTLVEIQSLIDQIKQKI